MEHTVKPGTDQLRRVFEYHQSTKHHFHRFASGPGYLDWASQPDPFRRYQGSRLIKLAQIPPTEHPLYEDAFVPGQLPCSEVNLRTISQLFFDSLAISAWKSIGTERWSLRVNPSSGNLHPTEGYLICGPIPDLCSQPMICHYAPREHALEVLAEFEIALWEQLTAGAPQGTLLMGLTSVHWREAWKYGHRAFRYCQHDAGHALAAISIAAAGLGWQTTLMDDLGSDEVALLTGTFRCHDVEPEEADMILAISPGDHSMTDASLPKGAIEPFRLLDWQGTPNPLSHSHVEWGMADIATAVKKPRTAAYFASERPSQQRFRAERSDNGTGVSLRKIIRQRRSALAMDGITSLPKSVFYRILQKTMPVAGQIPFNSLPWKPVIHLAIFVHRVDELDPGLYLLVREPGMQETLKQALTQDSDWSTPADCPEHLPLYCLQVADAREAARQIACFQEIASDGCFSLGMVAEFEAPLTRLGAWFYCRLFWEAGLVGQVLYLEAEAAGIRSTGIGCYFDDPMHQVLGLKGRTFQDLYHFTIGGYTEDTRLMQWPAYPE